MDVKAGAMARGLTPRRTGADHGALVAAAHGAAAHDAHAHSAVALCTIVGIEGSFSRRVGAQLAITPEGDMIGSLSDGCLERQLASEALAARSDGLPRLLRFGRGSPFIDFRLPCGSGLDILVDPAPDRAALSVAVAALDARLPAAIGLPLPGTAPAHLLRRRSYMPALDVLAFGEGPELAAFTALASAVGITTRSFARDDGLALGQAPAGLAIDRWTAILLLFHDHEWERDLLPWALASEAFYIGAQGGATARDARREDLRGEGWSAEAVTRVRSPIGLIPRARDPQVLALSVLAEVVAGYEARHPHG